MKCLCSHPEEDHNPKCNHKACGCKKLRRVVELEANLTAKADALDG